MLRRRVPKPPAPPAEPPAELRDPHAEVWTTFEATRSWCETYGLSNGQAGWSAMAVLGPEGRHQVAAEWWAILSGHFHVFGTVKFADWGYLRLCKVPHARQRRLRKRLDGIEIPAGSRRDREEAADA